MIKGQTINISLNPVVSKNIRETERNIPVQVDMRNFRLSDIGTPYKRNGYSQKWDTTNEYDIVFMLPEDSGYAMDSNGELYVLGSTVNSIYTSATLTSRPQWTKYSGRLYITTGNAPIKITNGFAELMGGDPVFAKWIAHIDDRVILSGHEPNEVRYSSAGNAQDFTVASGGGFFNTPKTASTQNMIEYRNRLYFFRERDIVVYAPTGVSNAPFRIQQGLKIDKGILSPESVVKANDTFYWFGEDYDFYLYDGGARIISGDMRARIDSGSNHRNWIGFDITKEHVIMWINHADGMTLVYDYKRNQWLEDNRWEGSGWQALPFNSYMELGNKQYFGSSNLDGLIHEWSDSYYDDNGQNINAFRHVKTLLSQRHNRARVNRLRFKFKRGVATSGEASPEITVRTRFDQGDWETHSNLSLGAVGTYDPFLDIHRVGIGRELEVEISEQDAVEYVLTDMIITAEELTQ